MRSRSTRVARRCWRSGRRTQVECASGVATGREGSRSRSGRAGHALRGTNPDGVFERAGAFRRQDLAQAPAPRPSCRGTRTASGSGTGSRRGYRRVDPGSSSTTTTTNDSLPALTGGAPRGRGLERFRGRRERPGSRGCSRSVWPALLRLSLSAAQPPPRAATDGYERDGFDAPGRKRPPLPMVRWFAIDGRGRRAPQARGWEGTHGHDRRARGLAAVTARDRGGRRRRLRTGASCFEQVTLPFR